MPHQPRLPELTVVNRYRLLAPAPAFLAAISALAGRVRDEGERGVLAYRFFVDSEAATARAVIDYATPAAWIGHHDIAMAWPEMRALHAVARLEEAEFLGPLTPEIAAWLARSGLSARILQGATFAAGFRRP